MESYVVTIVTLSATILATGALLASTPYLMRQDDSFAVTVPVQAQDDPRIRGLRRCYAIAMLVVTALSVVACVLGGTLLREDTAGGPRPGGGDASTILTCLLGVVPLVPVVASFVLMLCCRRRVLALKRSEGWQATRCISAAVLAEEDVPRAIPLAWSLLYLPVILGTIALGLALFPRMPDMIPLHADLAGNVDRYVPKTLASAVGLPVATEAFVAFGLTLVHWAILRSKRPVDPAAPATSALSFGLFARAQSVFVLVAGILTDAATGILLTLSAAGLLGLAQAGALLAVCCVPVLMGMVVLSFVYGQGGSRVFGRMRREAPLLRDDDEHWKLGILYLNRDDASLFLPKRFGIGWTMNFAHPAAWAIILGLIAASALFVALTAMLA